MYVEGIGGMVPPNYFNLHFNYQNSDLPRQPTAKTAQCLQTEENIPLK